LKNDLKNVVTADDGIHLQAALPGGDSSKSPARDGATMTRAGKEEP